MVFKPVGWCFIAISQFENDVKIYGIQTQKGCTKVKSVFENDVKIYGIQTMANYVTLLNRLRMM